MLSSVRLGSIPSSAWWFSEWGNVDVSVSMLWVVVCSGGLQSSSLLPHSVEFALSSTTFEDTVSLLRLMTLGKTV